MDVRVRGFLAILNLVFVIILATAAFKLGQLIATNQINQDLIEKADK